MSLQPIDRDAVLNLVKMRGPLIPNELKKALGQGDTMLLGAMLSELNGKGLVKISKTKLGGSPFYYDPQHPEKLERIAQHLGEKDQRTWKLLQEAKILRDNTQEALVRVSLRNIKDFAIPLHINAPEGELLFWKYYLISNSEAERLIKEELGLVKKESPKEVTLVEEKKEAPPEPVKEVKERTPIPQKKSESAPEVEAKAAEAKTAEKQESLTKLEEIDDAFYQQVRRYFEKNGITIKTQKLLRKKSEIDFIIELPTPVGAVEYYCKAKAKKKSNDGDLASAKLQGTTRQLPTLYLTTGEITKKAKEKLQNDFKGLVVKEL